MTSKDGGPAFPTRAVTEAGMSLRDYFAGQALIAIASRWAGTVADIDLSTGKRTAAKAYEIADAMLEARTR